MLAGRHTNEGRLQYSQAQVDARRCDQNHPQRYEYISSTCMISQFQHEQWPSLQA